MGPSFHSSFIFQKLSGPRALRPLPRGAGAGYWRQSRSTGSQLKALELSLLNMCVTGHVLSPPLLLHVHLCPMEQRAGLPPLVAVYCVPSNQQELRFPEFPSSVALSPTWPPETSVWKAEVKCWPQPLGVGARRQVLLQLHVCC